MGKRGGGNGLGKRKDLGALSLRPRGRG